MINKDYIKKEIKSYLLDSVYELLKQSNAMIVGGTLTSILTRKPVNDIDVYFKSEEDFVKAILDIKKILLISGICDSYALQTRV